MQRQRGEDRLDAAGSAQQVPGHRLGRVHDDRSRVVAERRLDRLGLVDVAERRRGAVRIQVIDLVGVRYRRCAALRACSGAAPSMSRLQSCERRRRSCRSRRARSRCARRAPGVLVLLEHQDAGAFAEHEAVAVRSNGRLARRRIVVARRQRLHRVEARRRPVGEIVDSAPPATITSASPYSISRPPRRSNAGRWCTR